MSQLIAALQHVPLHSVALTATTLVTAYPFLSNVSDYQRGAVAILNGRCGPVPLSPEVKARIFSAFFASAAKWVVGSTSTAAVLGFTTAFLHPVPLISHLALASGVFSSLQIPSTIALGIPKYFGPILKMDSSHSLEKVTAGSIEGLELDALIAGWESRHLIRFAVTGPALLCCLLGLMLDGHV